MAIRPRALLASLLLTGGTAALAGAADWPRQYKDWGAGCDQAALCRAVGMPADAAGGGAILVVDRAAGATGGIAVRLTRSEGLGSGKAVFLIDGRRFEAPVDADSRAAVWTGAIALEIARLVGAGRSASLSEGGQLPEPVSLSGSRAALLYLDDVQKRVGTDGALVKPGTARDTSSSRPAPTVMLWTGKRSAPATAALAAAVRNRAVFANSDCNIGERPPQDDVAALDGQTTLVLLECGSGAYNLVQIPFLVTRGNAASAREIGGAMKEGVFNAGFDPVTGQLSTFDKGRGIGDCGELERWGWTGKAFVPVERTVMGECRGVPSDWWIRLFRASPVPIG